MRICPDNLQLTRWWFAWRAAHLQWLSKQLQTRSARSQKHRQGIGWVYGSLLLPKTFCCGSPHIPIEFYDAFCIDSFIVNVVTVYKRVFGIIDIDIVPCSRSGNSLEFVLQRSYFKWVLLIGFCHQKRRAFWSIAAVQKTVAGPYFPAQSRLAEQGKEYGC